MTDPAVRITDLSAGAVGHSVPSSLSLIFSPGGPLRQIPEQLGDMRNLRELLLDDNQLTGGLPSEMGGLALLRNLCVRDNSYSLSWSAADTRAT